MVGRIMLGAGILAALLSFSMDCHLLFWLSVAVVAGYYLTSWFLLCCARRGFAKRLTGLREALLYSRTLEKRLQNNHSVDVIERDDVDVLIAKVLRGWTAPKDIPGWAICDIHQINELQGLCQGDTRGLDPDAQPTWLCVVGTLFLVGCPVLFVLAFVRKVAG
jgi:hypothetical protein